jgi:hypothetical protein
MTRRSLSVWGILTLIVVLFIVPGSAIAKSTMTSCTGTETLVDVLDPGIWTFPDGRIHVRGMVMQYEEVSSCPQLAGINTVTMNANWDANEVGPIWGTARPETHDGGVWEVTWTGKTYADGSSAYRAVGHGVAGSVEGLHAQLYATNGEWTATILDPHGG